MPSSNGILEWFTQPEPKENAPDLNFASFYSYNIKNKIFVRVRLELRRDPFKNIVDGSIIDDGSTAVIYENNRYVGFVSGSNFSTEPNYQITDDNYLLLDHTLQATIIDDEGNYKLTYDIDRTGSIETSLEAVEASSDKDYYTCDFTGLPDPKDDKIFTTSMKELSVHIGNKVIIDENDPRLKFPPRIDKNKLRQLVKISLNLGASILLTNKDSSPENLSKEIEKKIKENITKSTTTQINNSDSIASTSASNVNANQETVNATNDADSGNADPTASASSADVNANQQTVSATNDADSSDDGSASEANATSGTSNNTES